MLKKCVCTCIYNVLNENNVTCFLSRATSNVWHTGDQARVAQSGYYSGQEFPSTGYQKDDYQPPTGYPDNTQPYPAHNMTQGAAYSDPQTGFGYSSPTGGYTSPTSPPCDPVLPPYTPPSAPDTGTTQPGGQKDPLGAPPPYDQAVSLNNGPK